MGRPRKKPRAINCQECVSVYVGRYDNGGRKYKKFYGRTKAEAEKKANRYRTELNLGINPERIHLTFGEIAKEWIDNIKKSELSLSQKNLYIASYKNCAPIYPVKFDSLRASQIENMLMDIKSKRTGEPLGTKSKKAIKSFIIQVYEREIKDKQLEYNPGRYVTIREDKKPKRIFLSDEQVKLVTHKNHPFQPIAFTLLYTGLRKGELIGLQKKNINLKLENRRWVGYINVERAADLSANTPTFKTPKTKSSIRSVALPPIMCNYIKKEGLDKGKSEELVFTDGGKPWTEHRFRTEWKKYIKFLFDNSKERKELLETYIKEHPEDTELENFHPALPDDWDDITPHAMRRTNCKMLCEAGIGVKTAQLNLGHSDSRTTLDIYSMVCDKTRLAELQKIDAKSDFSYIADWYEKFTSKLPDKDFGTDGYFYYEEF